MSVHERFRNILNTVGRAGANALFPNDFEYYLVTLELVDSKGKTVDYLSFPVTPDQMDHDDMKLVSIKKSLGGISAIDTDTFNPKTIVMTGTFGRQFMTLLSKPITSESAATTSSDNGVTGTIVREGIQVKKALFDPKIKTGYGTLKLLESILDKSTSTDINNEPFRLYLYNPALGHNWLVKANKNSLTQNRESSNMLWRYQLTLTAIAPLESIREDLTGTLLLNSGLSIVSKKLTDVLNTFKASL